jgi:imidazoleglycerol-phosphate dehydratase
VSSMRRATSRRETKETRIEVDVVVDGSGAAAVVVPLPFFGHMLETFTKHSGMDVRLSGDGDVGVDAHHLVEDCGLVLGAAVSDALGARDGIHRFGHAYAPLDEALVRCAADYGRRPHVVYAMRELRGRINDFDVEVLGEFVKAYAQAAGATIHIDYLRGDNLHHIAEAAFKALGLASRAAFTITGSGSPSTKGML